MSVPSTRASSASMIPLMTRTPFRRAQQRQSPPARARAASSKRQQKSGGGENACRRQVRSAQQKRAARVRAQRAAKRARRRAQCARRCARARAVRKGARARSAQKCARRARGARAARRQVRVRGRQSRLAVRWTPAHRRSSTTTIEHRRAAFWRRCTRTNQPRIWRQARKVGIDRWAMAGAEPERTNHRLDRRRKLREGFAGPDDPKITPTHKHRPLQQKPA